MDTAVASAVHGFSRSEEGYKGRRGRLFEIEVEEKGGSTV